MNELLTTFQMMSLCIIELAEPCAFCSERSITRDALTSSSISTACWSPNQMPAPLHKVEEERCHSLNRIYGLSVRHKLDSKYITLEVAASTATCLYWCPAKIHTEAACAGSCLLARQTKTLALRSPSHPPLSRGERNDNDGSILSSHADVIIHF